MTDNFEYHKNKSPHNTYISKRFPPGVDEGRKLRIASKVFDSTELDAFALEKEELIIRRTPGEKQEIKATFYEDSRHINSLTIQRFTIETGEPHKASFTFNNKEIVKIIEFVNNLKFIDLSSPDKINILDSELTEIPVSKTQVNRIVNDNPEAVLKFVTTDFTEEDIVALGYRKEQLERFRKLLKEPEYFKQEFKDNGFSKKEALWQNYFEQNKWIFGYGLSYIFLSGLEDKKLEQTVAGFDLNSSGKRQDAVMKTMGMINSLCFVEIKTHLTKLLKNNTCRPGCWSVSPDLSEAVAQVHGTVSEALQNLPNKTEVKDMNDGSPTGETVYNYHPKSFLVVGTLEEFKAEHGVNEDKYRSFELFRRNLTSPEIITFDELYYRAYFIVNDKFP